MREKLNAQTSLFDPQSVDHPVADDLERASAWLDAHPELLAEIADDLGASSASGRGRRGLSCETVLHRVSACPGFSRKALRPVDFDTACVLVSDVQVCTTGPPTLVGRVFGD